MNNNPYVLAKAIMNPETLPALVWPLHDDRKMHTKRHNGQQQGRQRTFTLPKAGTTKQNDIHHTAAVVAAVAASGLGVCTHPTSHENITRVP